MSLSDLFSVLIWVFLLSLFLGQVIGLTNLDFGLFDVFFQMQKKNVVPVQSKNGLSEVVHKSQEHVH